MVLLTGYPGWQQEYRDFYETSDHSDRNGIYGTGISTDQGIFKAADSGGIPACVPGWKNYVTGTMGKCIISYCLIFGITFAELVAGLFLLGIKNAFAIAFIIAVLDILPVLGTGTVLIPWAVLASHREGSLPESVCSRFTL